MLPNKKPTYNIKYSSPNRECVTQNQHSMYLRKDEIFISSVTLATEPYKIEIEEASKSSNQELSEVEDSRKFLKGLFEKIFKIQT